MSVIKADRKESRLEAVVYAEKVHDILTKLGQENYGIRDVRRALRPKYVPRRNEDPDIDYYLALLRNARTEIDTTAYLLSDDVRSAYSIYPTDMEEYNRRREYQDFAIAKCAQIQKDLGHIAEIFNVNLNMFEEGVKAVDREKELIKKWRQRDNRFKRKLRGSL